MDHRYVISENTHSSSVAVNMTFRLCASEDFFHLVQVAQSKFTKNTVNTDLPFNRKKQNLF